MLFNRIKENSCNTGTVEARFRTAGKLVAHYKNSDIDLQPTSLCFEKEMNAVDRVFSSIGRHIDQKREFLLAPSTKVLQEKDDLLILISECKTVTNQRTEETTVMKEPKRLKELTIKFSSSAERKYWMEIINNECNEVYLKKWNQSSEHFSSEFALAMHEEIWSAILRGNEPLRKAYVALAGSAEQPEYNFVSLVLSNVIDWLKKLLDVSALVPVHKKVFVAMLSLMLQDAAARAFLMLLRPAPNIDKVTSLLRSTFLHDYAKDNVVGDFRRDCVLEKCAAALSFVMYVKERVLNVGWKPCRTFLAIVGHPAMPLRSDLFSSYLEVETAPGDELAWLSRCGSLTSEITWITMKSVLRNHNSTLLTNLFLTKKVQEEENDERVRKVMVLVDRVPDRAFATIGVAKQVRQHFRAWLDYCKFREAWEVFCANEDKASLFFKALRLRVWSQVITPIEGSSLRDCFIGTAGSGSGVAVKFAEVLTTEMTRVKNSTTFECFKKISVTCIERWVKAIAGVPQLTAAEAPIFVKLLIAAVKSAVLRAVLVIVEARRDSKTADGNQYCLETAENRLTRLLIALNQQKDDRYLLYLLHELSHPGTKQDEDGTVTFLECTWEVESDWLWATQRSLTIMFDTEDFALLADPAYLLFRYVSQTFRDIGESNVHGLVNKVQKSLPDIVDKAFYAHDNYLPCREHQHIHCEVPVERAHFKHLLTYTLFHEMWKIIMPRLTNPSLDLGFSQTVMYSSWLLVNSNANPDLSRLLLPRESDLHWQKLTYLVAVQRHAIITIARGDHFQLSRPFVIPAEATVSPDDVSAHNLLIDRIIKWVCFMLGNRRHHLEVADAALFMELFTAAAADGAMRAFLVTFLPAPSTVVEFMRSPSYTTATSTLGVRENPTPGENHAASVCLVKLLAQTFRSDKWRQYRSFLTLLDHPVCKAGSANETEPLWADESKWIEQRLQLEPTLVSWQELGYIASSAPYIHLLLTTQVITLVEQSKATLLKIPAQYLAEKFIGHSSDADTSALCAHHFIAMCLHEATSEVALEVFQKHRMISDAFFEALLSEAVSDSTGPRLLQAFHLVQRFLYDDNIPSISSVLITFLCDPSQRENFRRDEKIIGNLILLVFQLELSSNVSAMTASKLMRPDSEFTTRQQFFEMVKELKFPKWLSEQCCEFNVHLRKNIISEPSALEAAAVDTTAAEKESTGGDVMLDPTIPLTMRRLTMGIVGFFNLCLEFKPEALYEFVAGLGTGRPFFFYESLTKQVLLSLTSILSIKHGTILHGRVQKRFLFYDNDHLTPAAVRTLGLRTSKMASPCLHLTDSEFTDLLTVAMYMHDLHNLNVRFENVVKSMLANAKLREMVVKFMEWICGYHVAPDIERDKNQNNSYPKSRIQWLNCELFKNVSFEDIIECTNEAIISSRLLRKEDSGIMERLFEHYIRNSRPEAWKNLFRGSKTIAYFIKYVAKEDLNLAFSKFFGMKMNKNNNIFKHHLLKVRKLLTEPIVSAHDLLQLTASNATSKVDNADVLINQLILKAENLSADQADLEIVYLLTARWMKISKEKVLFPLPPRNAQIITLLTVASWAKSLLVKKDKSMGKALIAQVGTGEGKSLIIAMMAIYFVVVMKKRVHILENNLCLLEKDVETMTPLFAEFGIRTKHEGAGSKPALSWISTANPRCSDFCKFGVTYCLRRNLEHYYRDSIIEGDSTPLANTVLIVDEVDDLIVDKKPNNFYVAEDCEQEAFTAACKEAEQESSRNGGNLNVVKFAKGDFVREAAAYAYIRAKDMKLDRDYAKEDGKYVILKNGEPVNSYDCSLECLKFIKDINISPKFRSVYYAQSVPYMMSQYDCITGFSGQLGSTEELKFVAQEYNAWSFGTPPHLDTCSGEGKVPPKLMDDVEQPGVPCVHVYDTVDEQMDKIAEMCLRLHLKVPVLVIAKSTEEAIAIEAKVKAAMLAQPNGPPVVEGTKHKYVQLFRQYKLRSRTLDKENWGHMVRRATSRGPEEDRYCITVTDPFGGRGHDYDVHDDEVNSLGGLAVIITYIPDSKREWGQDIGRTARKDNRGQYAVVLNNNTSPVLRSSTAADILSGCALKHANGTAIPNLYKEELIDLLLSLQDKNQIEKLGRLRSSILTGKRLNCLCDAYYRRFGFKKERAWPEGDNDIALRKLLDDYDDAKISKFVKDLKLEMGEEEPADAWEPPDVESDSFWSAENAEEWR